MFEHIQENAILKEILIESVNGHNNHVHCLFRLKNNQTLESIMQLLKGESSYWFNKNKLLRAKLVWQKEYFAVSVSELKVNTVKNYILNQEEHHRKKTWEEEYNEFIENYGFRMIKG